MPLLSTVLLTIKGEARKANIQLTPESNLTTEILQKYFKKKDDPERICYWEYDNKVIFIIGYQKGKKGTENKTELPEPYSSIGLFGDAIVIASTSNKWDNPIPFTVEQWNTFCSSVDGQNIEDDEDDEDANESEEEENEIEEEDAVSTHFDDESEKNSIVDIEEEEELEEAPVPVKRKRAAAYTKVDTTGLKEEIPINSEPETNKMRVMCLNSLTFLEDKFSKDDIRSLERGIFEASYLNAQKGYIARNWKTHQFIEIYRQTVISVLSNIHPQSPVKNPRLLNRVLEGEFKLADIPAMSSYEMFPEKWFELKDKLLQREQKILEGNKSRATDQFKCRRCGKRECTYYELQTRSADEPMTIFVTCLNCGKEWRNGG
jgi:transcription elongation factor S-II